MTPISQSRGMFSIIQYLSNGILLASVVLRPASAESQSNFTLVVLPDTQKYAANRGGGTPEIFIAQTQWIAEKRDALNIVYVAHLGDCVNHADREEEWVHADTAFRKLEGSRPIPYGIAVGNHDKYIYRSPPFSSTASTSRPLSSTTSTSELLGSRINHGMGSTMGKTTTTSTTFSARAGSISSFSISSTLRAPIL